MENSGEQQRDKFVRRPSREIRLRTSKDGKYVMVHVVETWFFPTRYVAAVVDNAGKPKSRSSSTKTRREAKKVGS